MKQVTYFHPALRVLHWLMTAAILSMLFIGMAMVSTVPPLHNLLVSIRKPLGVMILLLVITHLWVRFTMPTPSLSAAISAWQRGIAHPLHWVLYLMMSAQPLTGWAMLSTAGYSVILGYGIALPPILGVSNDWYAELRPLYTWVALALFATVMLHPAAALLHAFVLRDGVFNNIIGIRKS